jgi:multidrug efflux pump subunit AcrA (membrane-fusion protein)
MILRGTLILLAVLAAYLLSGCGAFAQAAPTPLPTVVLGSSNPAAPQGTLQGGGGVTASGVVVSAQEVQIASSVGETVEAINVAAGDQVAAGQVLVKLTGSQTLEAAISAANLELLSAQLAMQTLKDNAAQARADAQLRLANAQKALDDA